MEYLAASIFFSFFYMIIYVAPFTILNLLYNNFLINIIPGSLHKVLFPIFLIVMFYQFGVSQYRENLAAGCRVNSSMTIKEASKASKVLLHNILRFIPIFGFFYRIKE